VLYISICWSRRFFFLPPPPPPKTPFLCQFSFFLVPGVFLWGVVKRERVCVLSPTLDV